MMTTRLDSYIETALWSSSCLLPCDALVDGCMDVDENHPCYGIHEGDNLDDHFDGDDLTVRARATMTDDLNDFFDRLEKDGLLELANEFADDEHIAHDFWLTRNGHGAGFWDGDYDDHKNPGRCIGRALTNVAEEWGECSLYITDSGEVEIF